MHAATSEKKQPRLNNVRLRHYRVLFLLLYGNFDFFERFGEGYMRVNLVTACRALGMNHARFYEDLQRLQSRGAINQLTRIRGNVLFQIEEPLWNVKNRYSSAIQDIQRRKAKTKPT